MADLLKRLGTGLWLLSEMFPPRTRGPGRVRCALIHARLALTRRVREAMGVRSPVHTSFLGVRVHCASYATLWATFMELFVRREYPIFDEPDDAIIIDCGANVGLAILYFKLALPRARITAFEASPTTFETLKQNMEANRLHDVDIRNQAVAKDVGTLELFVDERNPNSAWASSVRPIAAGKPTLVPAVRLSDVITDRVDILKLDIEGAEHGVLEDLAAHGTFRHIRRIILELHHHMTPDDNRMGRALRILEDAGMHYQLRPAQRWSTDRREFQTFIVDAYWPKDAGAA